jgi:hypothetical protein
LPALMQKRQATLIGQDGWLYLCTHQTTGGATGRRLFTSAELDEWEQALRQRAAWLAERGIAYVVMFTPDKPSIYAEHLPKNLGNVPQGGRLDQLLERLRSTAPELTIVDPRTALIAGKTDYPTYFRTDTHWNEYGAWLGYRELMRGLDQYFTSLQPSQWSDFDVSCEEVEGQGDLLRILGNAPPMAETNVYLRRRVPPRATFVTGERGPHYYEQRTSECPGAELKSAIVLHDSFFAGVQPHFSEHFQRVDYFWGLHFCPEEIERLRPQIVVQEIVERFLEVPPPEAKQTPAEATQ